MVTEEQMKREIMEAKQVADIMSEAQAYLLGIEQRLRLTAAGSRMEAKTGKQLYLSLNIQYL